MVFTLGRGFVIGASFGLQIRSLRCRVLVRHAADTASWVPTVHSQQPRKPRVATVNPETTPEAQADPSTMGAELAKGLESGFIKGWAGASDEQILKLEDEYLAADGRSMQDTVDEAKKAFDNANKTQVTHSGSNERSLGLLRTGWKDLQTFSRFYFNITRHPVKANPDLQDAFLAAYGVHGEVKAAAKACGVSRQSHYLWMNHDDEYRAKFRGLRYAVCQMIEDSLAERLAFGWDEAVYHGGELVGYKKRFDNANAISYLDRHSPDWIKGKQQKVDITSNGGTFPTVQFTMPSNGRNPGDDIVNLAQNDPDYLEYKRQKMLAEDAQ